MKIVIYGLIGLLLGGCALQQEPQPMPPKKVVLKTSTPTKRSAYKTPTSASSSYHNGMIRGVIMDQTYNASKKVWVHEVKAIDATNAKLKSAKFVHTKRVHKKGDLVYAIIKYGKLQEIYLIKAAYHKTPSQPRVVKKAPIKIKKKVQRRTKLRQTPWIAVPKEENISLD